MELRAIPGFPGYFARSDGLIIGKRLMVPLRADESSVYLRVTLAVDGKSVRQSIHRLVYLAFIGPWIDGLHIAHDDGNARNNVPGNLIQKTRAQNNAQKVEHGTSWRGCRNPRARLTPELVRQIRAELSPGSGIKRELEMAAKLSVSPSCIDHVVEFRSWTHV